MAVIPHVADDQLIETGWGNAVADAAVSIFASVAERDTLLPATAGLNGTMCRTLADSRVWMVIAGVWRLIAGSMPRVLLRRSTPQSAFNAGNTLITWDVEVYDTDALHAASASAIVIPTAFAGRWHFDYTIGFDFNGGGGTRSTWIDSTPYRYCGVDAAPQASAGNAISGSVEIVAVAAQAFNLYAYQTSGGTLGVVMNATAHYFSAQYVGPA